MEQIIFYRSLYIVLIIIFLFINSIIKGFNQVELSWKDLFDALIWPFSLGIMIGLLIKVIMQIIKNKKIKK